MFDFTQDFIHDKKTHNDYCVSFSIPFNICDKTSHKMDIAGTGGCKHRSKGHGLLDCQLYSLDGKSLEEQAQKEAACYHHRDVDRFFSANCGCPALYEEYGKKTLILTSLVRKYYPENINVEKQLESLRSQDNLNYTPISFNTPKDDLVCKLD